jgi:hypothetical protein
MSSKLIVLPTEMTIKRSGLSKARGKRIAESDASDSDQVAGNKHREDDTESESYPDSDAGEDTGVKCTGKRREHEGSARKKICSESGSSSEVTSASRGGSTPSQVTCTSSRSSGSISSNLITVAMTSAPRKPSAWELHRRKQEARSTGR